MICEDTGSFYQAVLTAGAILSGFNGNFLSFRIQREANYFRQPCTSCDAKDLHLRVGDGRKGHDVFIGRSRFNNSLFLIIPAAIVSMIFGVFMPLFALANWGCRRPETILAGIAASAVLVMAYFLNELIHYRIAKIKKIPPKATEEDIRKEIKYVKRAERLVVALGLIGAFCLVKWPVVLQLLVQTVLKICQWSQ